MAMKSVKFLLAAVGLANGSVLFAENLIQYDIASGGGIYYYDIESIKRNGDRLTVWVMVDESKNKSVTYRTARLKWMVDCSDETLGLMLFAYYRANGTLFRTQSTNYPDMTPVIPGSVGASLFKSVCEK